MTDKEIAAVRAKDVLRVEFIEDPGKQYGDDELGAVVNIIPVSYTHLVRI